MASRTFKRVLGETSLERKCRWWFGMSLVVLLTLSFTWYGRRTDKLVDDRIKTLSEELVRAGWQKLHIEKLAEIEGLPQTSRTIGRIFIASWPKAANAGPEIRVARAAAERQEAPSGSSRSDYLPQDERRAASGWRNGCAATARLPVKRPSMEAPRIA